MCVLALRCNCMSAISFKKQIMKYTFKPFYFTAFYTLLLIEIAIALLFKTGFIRHTVGDFLVTILLYCFIKSFVKLKAIYIALFVIAFAFIVEFLQLFNFIDYINLRGNKLVSTIIGTSFSLQDLLAYTLGVICIYVIDIKTSKKKNL